MSAVPTFLHRYRFLLRGIGVLLFLWILSRIDRSQLIASFAQASVPLLLVGWLLFPVIYLLKAWRWHVLIHHAGIAQPFQTSFRTYCSALFLGTITPGNVGESSKIAYLSHAGASVKDATLLTIVDRLYDALWIGMFAIPSVFFLLKDQLMVLIGVLCCISFFLITGGLLLRRRGQSLSSLTNLGFQGKPHAITMANWAVYYLQLMVFASAFHLTTPVLPFLGVMTIAGITNLLAIAPAGLGTRDAVVLYFLPMYGVPAAAAVAFSSSIFFLTILGSLIGAFFLLRPSPVHRLSP